MKQSEANDSELAHDDELANNNGLAHDSGFSNNSRLANDSGFSNNSGLANHLRHLPHWLLALLCLGLVAYTYYQMLFGTFSLPAFAQRALLTSMTAAVALLLHRLLFYRLPPAYSLLLWVVVLVQVAGVPLASFGVFDRGLENQLPEIEVQTQTELPDTALFAQGNGNAQTPTQLPEEVILSYPSGAQQTLSYSQTLAQAVRVAWLLGCSLVCLWFWGNYLLFVVRLPRGQQQIPAFITEAFATAKEKLQLTQPIRLMFTAKDGPLLLGVLRPRVILPLHLCTANTSEDDDLSFILLHEFTHAKHGDNIWSALATLALASQWYNPLIWLCFPAFKRDIERRCDCHVAAITRNKKAYATVLLKTIQQKG
ncbi:MAG: M56 family metallopeptidase [Faecalibacterium sp.]